MITMKYFKLNNGEKIPALNFGVFDIEPEDTKEVVLKALEVGYRSIDNAQIYYNEKVKFLLFINKIIFYSLIKYFNRFLFSCLYFIT